MLAPMVKQGKNMDKPTFYRFVHMFQNVLLNACRSLSYVKVLFFESIPACYGTPCHYKSKQCFMRLSPPGTANRFRGGMRLAEYPLSS